MVATDNTETTNDTISSESLPAILIGGPPKAGKSVLTYNLTRALRSRKIPHYVFRASPDGEGDWSFEGDLDTVREFHSKSKHDWSQIFREIACYDLPHRQVPLIVDLGGRPTEEDTCIFQTCQKAILLFKKDGLEKDFRTWHDYIARNKLKLIAEIFSQTLQTAARAEQETSSILSIEEPFVNDATYAIALYPTYNYLDFRVAHQLAFPEPPSHRGIVVSGKLPLWLFTALARFYAQRDVPWIALNDARDNKPVVIYYK
jgi:CRISPR-associated protein (Cas_csx3)